MYISNPLHNSEKAKSFTLIYIQNWWETLCFIRQSQNIHAHP